MNLIKASMKYCILILVLSIGLFGCSKGGKTPAPKPEPPVVVVEPSLTAANGVVIDIDPGATNIYTVIGTSQKFDVIFNHYENRVKTRSKIMVHK